MKRRDVYLKLTRHNGRAGTHGTYNPKHNDRSFNLANSEHIDQERAKSNIYWDCYHGIRSASDKDRQTAAFSDVEKMFYEIHYSHFVEKEILQMAISQKAFFGKKGGITFSGGEPTLQAEALIPLFKELKANGIHICLDSNGGIWNEKVEELFSLTDLVLLDIKQFNPERHRTLTGRSNEQTLRTAAWLEEHEHPFWLRYVLVPGYSDSEEDTRLLGESLGKYQQIQRVEILPYHRLGVHKYEAMGWDYKLKEVKENTPEQLERAEKLFKEYFTNVITN